MAANPLAVNLAAANNINITWGTWALAGLVPGLVCLVCVPLLLYALYPPEMKDTPGACAPPAGTRCRRGGGGLLCLRVCAPVCLLSALSPML